jgi:hypothetical protein
MAEFDPSMHRFRKVGDKYTYNDQDVSKEEFDQKQAEVDQAMQKIAPRQKPGRSLKDRAADAFKDLDTPPAEGNKKGGRIKTAVKNPKHKNCW